MPWTRSDRYDRQYPLSRMQTKSNRAFSLAEVLVAMTIAGLVVAGAIAATLQLLKSYSVTGARLKINSDMRKLTRDMTTDAVFANYFVIYPSFTNRSTSATANGVTTTIDNFVANGASGDFLVLVSVDQTTQAVTKLVGYYRDPPDGLATTAGPVRSFHIAVSSNSPTIYTILNSAMPTSSAHTNPVVIPLALGQSNGDLFYNYFGRSIMIKSKIEENGDLFTPLATHTYNFTVAPRG